MEEATKILIVEDSPTQAELYKYLLETHGYNVSVSYNGKEALDLIKKQRPDIVISDILMPEMDGYELCRHVKNDKNLKDTCFILLTVLSDVRDIIRGLECKADDFIIKPLKEQYLLSYLERFTSLKCMGKAVKKPLEILVVEDSPTQAELLMHLLEEKGYKVIVASSGEEALERMWKNKPNLIITDILMSRMDGYELCKRIKENEKLRDIPVILLTKQSSPEDIIRGYDVSADAYITKPFDEHYLLSKIKHYLENTVLLKRGKRIEEPLEVIHGVKKFEVHSDRNQILNFLLSTYDSAIQQNRELLNTQHELKRKFNELQVSEERFETLVKTIPDIVYRIDTEGRFAFLNESIQKLGYEPGELIGKHFSEIILPPQIRSISREYVLPQYQGKETGNKDSPKLFNERRTGDRKTIGLEVCLLTKGYKIIPGIIEAVGNNLVYVEINSSGLYVISQKDKKRKFLGTVGIIRDITERKKTEEALHKAMIEAKSANMAKSEFLANMSHELRTPLNSVLGFSEMMMEGIGGNVTDQHREYLERINDAGKHLLSLIDDILDLSKIEAGRTELEISSFSLKECCNDCIGMFMEKASKKDIKINLDIPEDIDNCTADKRRIKQIIFNLLGNAMKFTQDGGKVGIKVANIDEGIQITVWDTGIGISEEDQKKLFQPFQQVETTLSKKYPGTGLGLSLCKNFVELHGGRIWVESEVGKGSRFTFIIPVMTLKPE